MSDERTISDIVTDPELEEAEAIGEEEMEGATSEVTEDAFKHTATDISYAMQFAKPIQQAREEAHIPPQVTVKELEGKTFVIANKVRQKAFLPADGTQRDGWQCLCADAETGKPFTVWIGQVTLRRDLERLNLPLRVTLSKRGRAYIFA